METMLLGPRGHDVGKFMEIVREHLGTGEVKQQVEEMLQQTVQLILSQLWVT